MFSAPSSASSPSSSSGSSTSSKRTYIIYTIIALLSFALGLMVGAGSLSTNLDFHHETSNNNKQQAAAAAAAVTPSPVVIQTPTPAPMMPTTTTTTPPTTTTTTTTTVPPKPPIDFHIPTALDVSSSASTEQQQSKIIEKPKIAFVGYMDTVSNALHETKWMYFSALGSGVDGDILLMGHPKLRKIPKFCSLLIGGQNTTTVEGARQALNSQTCKENGWPLTKADNPNTTVATFPCRVRCLVIANERDDHEAVKLNYPFLRSLHFPNDAVLSELLTADYDYVLKTDLDVFFSPTLATLRPPPGNIYAGRGGYVNSQETGKRLMRIASDLGMQHIGQHNIGATWFGGAKLILEMTKLARDVTIYILRHEFKNGPGQWPQWWRGVASMYGSEIAVNHMAPKYLKNQLDMNCHNEERTCTGSVIHAWHQDTVFSKFHFHKYNASAIFEKAHSTHNTTTPLHEEDDDSERMMNFRKYMSTAGNFASYVAMNVRSGIEVPPHGPWLKGVCLDGKQRTMLP